MNLLISDNKVIENSSRVVFAYESIKYSKFKIRRTINFRKHKWVLDVVVSYSHYQQGNKVIVTILNYKYKGKLLSYNLCNLIYKGEPSLIRKLQGIHNEEL